MKDPKIYSEKEFKKRVEQEVRRIIDEDNSDPIDSPINWAIERKRILYFCYGLVLMALGFGIIRFM